MDKQAYEKPQLELLGTVQELTALVTDPGCGSVDSDFSTQDGICCIEECDI